MARSCVTSVCVFQAGLSYRRGRRGPELRRAGDVRRRFSVAVQDCRVPRVADVRGVKRVVVIVVWPPAHNASICWARRGLSLALWHFL